VRDDVLEVADFGSSKSKSSSQFSVGVGVGNPERCEGISDTVWREAGIIPERMSASGLPDRIEDILEKFQSRRMVSVRVTCNSSVLTLILWRESGDRRFLPNTERRFPLGFVGRNGCANVQPSIGTALDTDRQTEAITEREINQEQGNDVKHQLPPFDRFVDSSEFWFNDNLRITRRVCEG
jgi:hypothetical protein